MQAREIGVGMPGYPNGGTHGSPVGPLLAMFARLRAGGSPGKARLRP
jgi:hypothetical protein